MPRVCTRELFPAGSSATATIIFVMRFPQAVGKQGFRISDEKQWLFIPHACEIGVQGNTLQNFPDVCPFGILLAFGFLAVFVLRLAGAPRDRSNLIALVIFVFGCGNRHSD
eukprot:g1747.t1